MQPVRLPGHPHQPGPAAHPPPGGALLRLGDQAQGLRQDRPGLAPGLPHLRPRHHKLGLLGRLLRPRARSVRRGVLQQQSVHLRRGPAGVLRSRRHPDDPQRRRLLEIRKRTKVTAEATRTTDKENRSRGAFGSGVGGTANAPGASPLKRAAATVATIESVSKSFAAANEVMTTGEQNLTPNGDKGNRSEPVEKNCSQPRLSSDNKTRLVTTSDEDLQAKTLPSGRSLAPLKSGSYRDLPEVQGKPVLPGIRKQTSDVNSVTSSSERDPTRTETHQAGEAAKRPAPKQQRELALSPETGPTANGCLTRFNGKRPQPKTLAENPQIPRATRRELKAAKALFIFVFTFIVLWAPYTIATVAIAFCEDCVNGNVYEFFIWLLWFKSAVNPFLYAANSSRFKMNFATILRKVCFCWKQTRVWKAWGFVGPCRKTCRKT